MVPGKLVKVKGEECQGQSSGALSSYFVGRRVWLSKRSCCPTSDGRPDGLDLSAVSDNLRKIMCQKMPDIIIYSLFFIIFNGCNYDLNQLKQDFFRLWVF
ncbi:hypothetical protein CDAR_378481 [Caerostris darwini]|uniref:Uncharacterized protein n=1 Tax=Caerostris darwini TaxID=1538125 RepID=A0AAV4RUP5_9ARAC|nr:hypothetical protein CDAR_378481 [Caerostris darwini]